MKQIATGMLMYAQDFDERFAQIYMAAISSNWTLEIYPYVRSTQVFTCPSAVPRLGPSELADIPSGQQDTLNYGMAQTMPNILGYRVSGVRKPSETILLGEGKSYWVKPAAADPFTGVADDTWPYLYTTTAAATRMSAPIFYRHLEMANFAFLDGHVKAMRKETAEKSVASEDGVATTSLQASNEKNPMFYWNNIGN